MGTKRQQLRGGSQERIVVKDISGFTSNSPATPEEKSAATESRALCEERFRLRGEYIRLLGAFNSAARRYEIVVRSGMQEQGLTESWRSYCAHYALCHEAWIEYRRHVAAHGCSRGGVLTNAAA